MSKEQKEIQVCKCTVIHGEVIDQVRKTMPEEDTVYDLSELFKSFSDQTRLKILCALSKAEMCVCDMAALLDMTQSAISHQLRVLRNVRLIKYSKKGKVVYYSLDDDHVSTIIKQGMDHIEHTR